MCEMSSVRRVSNGDIEGKAVLQKLAQCTANMTEPEVSHEGGTGGACRASRGEARVIQFFKSLCMC